MSAHRNNPRWWDVFNASLTGLLSASGSMLAASASRSTPAEHEELGGALTLRGDDELTKSSGDTDPSQLGPSSDQEQDFRKMMVREAAEIADAAMEEILGPKQPKPTGGAVGAPRRPNAGQIGKAIVHETR